MSEDKAAEAEVDVDDKEPSGDGAPDEPGIEFQELAEERKSSSIEDPRDPAEDSSPDLKLALDEARSNARANWDMVIRTRAELDNVRKRAERDVANAHRYGLERVINEFLPIRDSLELGLSAAEDEADVVRIREGIALTLKLMETAFDKLGLEAVDPMGQPFDPEAASGDVHAGRGRRPVGNRAWCRAERLPLERAPDPSCSRGGRQVICRREAWGGLEMIGAYPNIHCHREAGPR